MKHLLLFLLIASTWQLKSQAHTISVRGQSHLVIGAVGLVVEFKMTEIERNDYQKIRGRSIDQIYNDLNVAIQDIGLNETAFTEPFPPPRYFQQQKVRVVELLLDSVEELKTIMDHEIKGLTVHSINYQFGTDQVNHEAQIELATKDAEQRAKQLTEVVGKKLGKIINVSTSISNYNSNRYQMNAPERQVTHTVTINYELLKS